MWWFLPYISMNQSRVYMCPPPHTPIPPPSPSQPSGLSQCTGFECPASCIELGLAVCFTYGDIHVSVLFSQITSPSAPPTESISLSFTSVSLPLPCIQDPCVCANILYRVLSLTSLCMMGFRLVHLIGTDSMCPL